MALLPQRAWVRSLVGELKSHTRHSETVVGGEEREGETDPEGTMFSPRITIDETAVLRMTSIPSILQPTEPDKQVFMCQV